MRTSPLRLLVFALLAAVPPLHTAQAQDPDRVTINGTVLDAVTGQPLEGVEVSMRDLGMVVVTDSEGAFTLTEVPLGDQWLAISREGYQAIGGRLQVHQGGDMTLRMNPEGGPSPSDRSRIVGRVRDLDGGRGLEGAAVSFPQLRLTRVADADGRFSFQDVPPGQHAMTVELLGYSTREELVAVEGKKILTLDLTLAVEPIELDPIEVSVEARDFDLEMSGFYDRRGATSGTFITREKIEDRAPLFTTDIFQGLAGVKVIGGLGMGTQQAVVLQGSRALSFYSGPGQCSPAVWIDDQMVHQGDAGPTGGGPAFLNQFIQPDQIAGVEIYASAAQVPVQYNLHAACGVIVLWTRRGR
jgi:hypothetical protein